MVLEPETDLLQMVGALGAPRRLASRLDRRQQQRDKDADNGDHHQEFDQRERMRGSRSGETKHERLLIAEYGRKKKTASAYDS
jgi:hypothetical protein